MRYTFEQRKKESTPKDLNKLILKKKKQKNIDEKLTNLNQFQGNRKSSSYDTFSNYIKARCKEEKDLYEFYENKLFRIAKWRTFRKKQRSEDKFIQTFKKKFGKDVLIAFGDWGNNQNPNLKHSAPSPNCHLLRKFKQHFGRNVIIVNEYRTTKCCHRCDSETDKFYLHAEKEDRKLFGIQASKPTNGRQIHGLGRCQNEECKVWLNRDYNAAINIRNKLWKELRQFWNSRKYKHKDLSLKTTK